MRNSTKLITSTIAKAGLAAALMVGESGGAGASDHFDSPAMAANPEADIADVYAWTATGGRQLNLVMSIAGHTFSDRIAYEFHIDSGKVFGRTTASVTITCRFPETDLAECRLGSADYARGDFRKPAGLWSRHHRFRVFAGRRDDPFYNNIDGSTAVYQTVTAAAKAGAPIDAAGCPHFDQQTVQTIAGEWSGGAKGAPPKNFLKNWTVAAIVLTIDLKAVSEGGKLLAIWGSTSSPVRRLDRMARPFVGNTLLGASPFSTDAPSGVQRDRYNAATPATAAAYVPAIRKSLAMHDGLDGKCANQLLAGRDRVRRYDALAGVFADDRLWVNSASDVCAQFLGVELAVLARRRAYAGDCGGRSPTYNMPDIWRSLLVSGTTDGVESGLREDEHKPSATVFPFLAPPDADGIDH
jgi:hypothetical protein